MATWPVRKNQKLHAVPESQAAEVQQLEIPEARAASDSWGLAWRSRGGTRQKTQTTTG